MKTCDICGEKSHPDNPVRSYLISIEEVYHSFNRDTSEIGTEFEAHGSCIGAVYEAIEQVIVGELNLKGFWQ